LAGKCGLKQKPLIFAARIQGAVAQLVEQRTENPCVGGSIPPHTTKGKNLQSNLRVFLLS
jgi:hypothetical protein